MSISIENLRNVAIVGQQGVGKTSLAEAMLHQAGVIDKMGSVKEKTTVSDYDKLEKERGFSINPSLLYLMWRDHKINLLDTPGFVDFIEKVKPVLRATESALVVISPSTVRDRRGICNFLPSPAASLNTKGSFFWSNRFD